jgi:presenilin-like A22 family membrane protease
MVTYTMAASNPTSASDTVITHPNRGKPVVQSTRLLVVVLLIVSAVLVMVITIGGWKVLENAIPIEFAYAIIYLLLAFFALRWNRGVLPVASSLAVFLAIFALVSGSSWFERNKAGFAQPSLNSGLLGTLTFLVIPVQILLIGFAMRGFSQGWNVELEQSAPGTDFREGEPHTA